jgi:hypothetical protein
MHCRRVTAVTDIIPRFMRHRPHADRALILDCKRKRPGGRPMNILLWYLPFAMFSETCDLLVSDRKVPPQAKPNPANDQDNMRDPGLVLEH